VGALLLNADDWGRDRLTTDRTSECYAIGALSSVSAMVFMEDSERAATIAREQKLDVGLHLNFTTPFSGPNCPTGLLERQDRVAKHLLRHKLGQIIFHPGFTREFDYLVAVQIDEFRRIYGAKPERFDGHHHMHLCANVLIQRLLPQGTIVRRNFSFERGEKSLWNRRYRSFVDNRLARRHRLTDYFFSLPPLDPPVRLQRIYSLSRRFVVEVETHPVNPDEYSYLAAGQILRDLRDIPIARPLALPRHEQTPEEEAP
jgi:hypothetical protein